LPPSDERDRRGDDKERLVTRVGMQNLSPEPGPSSIEEAHQQQQQSWMSNSDEMPPMPPLGPQDWLAHLQGGPQNMNERCYCRCSFYYIVN
jgi:hypothetical protein